jgi:hypothetical protein
MQANDILCIVKYSDKRYKLKLQAGLSYSDLKTQVCKCAKLDKSEITIKYYDHVLDDYFDVEDDEHVKELFTCFSSSSQGQHHIITLKEQEVAPDFESVVEDHDEADAEKLNTKDDQEDCRTFSLVQKANDPAVARYRCPCTTWEEVFRLFQNCTELPARPALMARDVNHPEFLVVSDAIDNGWAKEIDVMYISRKRVFVVHIEKQDKPLKKFKSESTRWNEVMDHIRKGVVVPPNFTIKVCDDAHDPQMVFGQILEEWGDSIDIIIGEEKYIKSKALSLIHQNRPSPSSMSSASFKPVVKTVEHYQPKRYTKQFQPSEFQPKDYKLPGFHAKRVKHGVHKKSVLVDNETFEVYGKNDEHIGIAKQQERMDQKHQEDKNQYQQQEQARQQEFKKDKHNFESREIVKSEGIKAQRLNTVFNAGIEGTQYGAISSFVTSTVCNSVDVYQDRKKVKDAFVDIVTDTGVGGAIGGATSTALSAISTYGASSSNKIIATLSSGVVANTNVIIPVLFMAWNIFKEYRKYAKGDITKKVFVTNLVKTAVTTAGSIGGTVGAVSLVALFLPAGPLLSIAVGALGCAMGGLIANHMMDKLIEDIIKEDPAETLQDALDFFGLDKNHMHQVNARYKSLVKIHHPDCGGSDSSFTKLQSYYAVIVANQPHQKPDTGSKA